MVRRSSNPLLNPFIATSPSMRMNAPKRRSPRDDDEIVYAEPDRREDESGYAHDHGEQAGTWLVLHESSAASATRSRSDSLVDELMMEIDETYESTASSSHTGSLIALPPEPNWVYSGTLQAGEAAGNGRMARRTPSLASRTVAVSAGSLAVAMLAIAPFVTTTLWAAGALAIVTGIALARPWAKMNLPAHKAGRGRVTVSLDGLAKWLRAGRVSLQPGGPSARWLEWNPLGKPRDLLLYWTPAGLKTDGKGTEQRLRETATFQTWARLDGSHVKFSVDRRYADLASWLSSQQPVTTATMGRLASSMSVAGLEPRVSSRGSQTGSTIVA